MFFALVAARAPGLESAPVVPARAGEGAVPARCYHQVFCAQPVCRQQSKARSQRAMDAKAAKRGLFRGLQRPSGCARGVGAAGRMRPYAWIM